VRYLSLADTEQLDLRMRDVVPIVEAAFRMVAAGRHVVAKRVRLVHPPLPPGSSGEGRPWTRDVRIIPGGLEGVGIGVRVGTALRQPGRDPEGGASGVVLLFFDWPTMALRGVISDHLVHAVRSTAPNGVAAKHLAPPDASSLAVIGSGRLARWAAEAVVAVRPIRRVRVWSPSAEHRDGAALAWSERLELDVEAVSGAQSAVRDAEVVVTATTARAPVVRAEWLRADATVLSNRPEELGADVLRDARLVTTYRDGTLDHAPPFGGLMELFAWRERRQDELVELSEVVAGRAPGRVGDGLVVCLNPAYGVLDAAVARYVLDRAEARGIGTELAP
jgi:ornithine cyclodeaminase/alanine dehydrogenase-like protein (mu-crystallin family)